MAQSARTEPQTVSLAQDVAPGMAVNATTYPPPPVAAYKIHRRLRPEGPWSDVGMAVESEITLSSQDRGKEFEYRVLAVNKAGDGELSNTVMAVL